VSSIEGKEEAKGNTTQVAAIKAYREKIEKELADSGHKLIGPRSLPRTKLTLISC